MLEPLQRTALPGGHAPAAALSDQALLAGWRTGLAIVNLRGNAEDPAFRAAVSRALNLELPVQPCSSVADAVHRLVWVGPDDWFVIGPRGQASAIVAHLHAALASLLDEQEKLSAKLITGFQDPTPYGDDA